MLSSLHSPRLFDSPRRCTPSSLPANVIDETKYSLIPTPPRNPLNSTSRTVPRANQVLLPDPVEVHGVVAAAVVEVMEDGVGDGVAGAAAEGAGVVAQEEEQEEEVVLMPGEVPVLVEGGWVESTMCVVRNVEVAAESFIVTMMI